MFAEMSNFVTTFFWLGSYHIFAKMSNFVTTFFGSIKIFYLGFTVDIHS